MTVNFIMRVEARAAWRSCHASRGCSDDDEDDEGTRTYFNGNKLPTNRQGYTKYVYARRGGDGEGKD